MVVLHDSGNGDALGIAVAPVSPPSHRLCLSDVLILSLLFLLPSYPLLKLPLPGTGPVEFSTPVKGYSPPPADSDHKQGEPSEQPEWVGARVVTEESLSRELIGGGRLCK